MAPKRVRKASPAPAKATEVKEVNVGRVTRSVAARKRVAGEEAAPPKPLLVKKAKAGVKKKLDVDGGDEVVDEKKGTAGGEDSKSIVVEACKQCNSFKTRALMVKEGLEAAVSDVIVEINPEKPRRGCFEIRDADGTIFISLLDMKRPFKPMKDLDMDEVIANIIKNIS